MESSRVTAFILLLFYLIHLMVGYYSTRLDEQKKSGHGGFPLPKASLDDQKEALISLAWNSFWRKIAVFMLSSHLIVSPHTRPERLRGGPWAWPA